MSCFFNNNINQTEKVWGMKTNILRFKFNLKIKRQSAAGIRNVLMYTGLDKPHLLCNNRIFVSHLTLLHISVFTNPSYIVPFCQFRCIYLFLWGCETGFSCAIFDELFRHCSSFGVRCICSHTAHTRSKSIDACRVFYITSWESQVGRRRRIECNQPPHKTCLQTPDTRQIVR